MLHRPGLPDGESSNLNSKQYALFQIVNEIVRIVVASQTWTLEVSMSKTAALVPMFMIYMLEGVFH